MSAMMDMVHTVINLDDENSLLGLKIAVIGFNSRAVGRMVRQIALHDESSVVRFDGGRRAYMADGTVYVAVLKDDVRSGRLDGFRFDQLIITDDERWSVYAEQWEAIQFIKQMLYVHSCVPEELRVQEVLYW